MIDKNTQEKIEFSGIIRSVQPRSYVWRYRLDNRTHSMTGYNLFLSGAAEGTAKDFTVAISVTRSKAQPGQRCTRSWNTRIIIAPAA